MVSFIPDESILQPNQFLKVVSCELEAPFEAVFSADIVDPHIHRQFIKKSIEFSFQKMSQFH